jgi:hypothetical protein
MLHFVGDFLLQTRKMADNKSKSIKWLTIHAITYCLPFLILINGGLSMNLMWFYIWLFITHWCTDFITSKLTSYLWKEKQVKAFFTIIGFDQLIHTITLLYLTNVFILLP